MIYVHVGHQNPANLQRTLVLTFLGEKKGSIA